MDILFCTFLACCFTIYYFATLLDISLKSLGVPLNKRIQLISFFRFDKPLIKYFPYNSVSKRWFQNQTQTHFHMNPLKRWIGSKMFAWDVECLCVLLCFYLFGWSSDQLCALKKKKRKNHKGTQRLRKQRRRCRSRLLPGIVRRTDEGGGWGKVRTLLNGFTNGRKPLSLSRWQDWATLIVTSCILPHLSMPISDPLALFW